MMWARNQSAVVYPYRDDPQRNRFSQLLKPLISEKWCRENSAQCDSENFDTDLVGNVIVNEAAKLFGFLAQFDVSGLGPPAEKQLLPQKVAYIFRERAGKWEHREFDAQQLRHLLGGMSFDELIAKKPDLAFQPSAGK